MREREREKIPPPPQPPLFWFSVLMQQRSLMISESSIPRESQGKKEKRKNPTLRKSLPPFPPTHQKNLPVSQSFKELERDARKLVKSQRSSLLP
jgi:hypothetical protein